MKNRGVTLIECVIAIGIISILSSIVMGKISVHLLKAKDIKVEADLEILRAASNFYYMEQNRALGDENVYSGSGIPKGESVNYTIYGDKKVATTVTYNHIQELVDKKYLERDILKKLSLFKDGSNSIKLIPGVNAEAQNCTDGVFKNKGESRPLNLVFSEDNIKINLWDGVFSSSENGEGSVDSNCKIWNMK